MTKLSIDDLKCNLRVHNKNGQSFLLILPLGYEEALQYAKDELQDDEKIAHIDIVIVSEKVLLKVDRSV
jgi:hypothetical protein